jgi:hypothetical protein
VDDIRYDLSKGLLLGGDRFRGEMELMRGSYYALSKGGSKDKVG